MTSKLKRVEGYKLYISVWYLEQAVKKTKEKSKGVNKLGG